MKDGFIKVAAATPKTAVADCVTNAGRVLEAVRRMEEQGAKIMVLPELCLTGYTCSDLFWQERLQKEAREQLKRLIQETAGVDALIFAGLPLEHGGKLFNVAAAFSRGRLLGLVPKKYLPNYNEFYEMRHFTPGSEKVEWIEWNFPI